MIDLVWAFLGLFALWVFAANLNDSNRNKGNYTTSEILQMYLDSMEHSDVDKQGNKHVIAKAEGRQP
jgi:hypothetical protein